MSEGIFKGYHRVFTQITTPPQDQAYDRIAKLMTGRVLDAGSGSGKLCPYLDQRVVSYTGVDIDPGMVEQGKRLLSLVGREQFDILCQSIEETVGEFETIVSIQSYYSWSDSQAVLRHLFEQTVDGGRLVLATANDRLNIELLIKHCARGLLTHPDWPIFVQYNRQYASLPNGRYVSLSTLFDDVQSAGYNVSDVDQTLFDGGMNLIIATK